MGDKTILQQAPMACLNCSYSIYLRMCCVDVYVSLQLHVCCFSKQRCRHTSLYNPLGNTRPVVAASQGCHPGLLQDSLGCNLDRVPTAFTLLAEAHPKHHETVVPSVSQTRCMELPVCQADQLQAML